MNRTGFLDGVKVVSTTEVCKRLGLSITATRLSSLGNVKPFAVLTVGTFWREEDFPLICTTIGEHLLSVAAAALVTQRASE